MNHRDAARVEESPRWVQGILGLALLLAGALGCTRELPEEGSAATALYRDRCGECHRAYSPASLKFPTWELIVSRMDGHMRRAPRGVLTPEERATILDYLRRHAG